ncbi:MAG TPA: hypothetical protein VIA18_24320, partial [Polyangia bacterium]|nr:hypothetical protein [Polyangia bacterium]
MKRSLTLVTLIVAGCGGSSGSGTSTGGGGASGIAVIDSDYKSTVLSLIDGSGTKLSHDDCLDSGTVSTSLSTALSGDVIVGGVQPNGDVLVIDRMNSAL